ncbi:hypothetical protein U3450_003883 [Bacillus cytotoxicus]|uniref:hypothetical protein n=1 Tax=unclassified Bacillus cereus group TaxID=2750818 RepID=UPI001F593E9F|nr:MULTISPECIES: hypothetical protein [unclassified Bacillus cereus group]EMA6344827.1 hypothetical protein [Bacillus cytotoxicus]
MNIERQYIEKVIVDMEKRMNHLTKMRKLHNEKLNSLEDDGTFEEGLYKGYKNAQEREMDFLKTELTFLKGALEK